MEKGQNTLSRSRESEENLQYAIRTVHSGPAEYATPVLVIPKSTPTTTSGRIDISEKPLQSVLSWCSPIHKRGI
jgi:hypothetical protein